ncbi:MAG: hypothetical protein O3C63_07610, partial [Cyanobacteria bacterium]|nr:hypothetical protein [Cyanobacteriota bacterium]
MTLTSPTPQVHNRIFTGESAARQELPTDLVTQQSASDLLRAGSPNGPATIPQGLDGRHLLETAFHAAQDQVQATSTIPTDPQSVILRLIQEKLHEHLPQAIVNNLSSIESILTPAVLGSMTEVKRRNAHGLAGLVINEIKTAAKDRSASGLATSDAAIDLLVKYALNPLATSQNIRNPQAGTNPEELALASLAAKEAKEAGAEMLNDVESFFSFFSGGQGNMSATEKLAA